MWALAFNQGVIMKIRSHILLRFKDLRKSRIFVDYKPDDKGCFRYSFSDKVVLVVNALEHEQIQKQLAKGL